MRAIGILFAIVAIGLGLGGALAWVSIQKNLGIGALHIGGWTAWPLAGSNEADPYSKAKVSAEGDVPLGAAEGLAFHADRDEKGELLRLECRYALQGQTPPARFWTLTAHLPDGNIVTNPNGRASTVFSRTLVRQRGGSFNLETGPRLAAQNWMMTSGKGPFGLIMRLYDSPITSTSGIVDLEMPSIRKLGCQ